MPTLSQGFLLSVLAAGLGSGAPAWEAEGHELFSAQIAPLLGSRCLDCHGGVQRRGGLSLITREALLAGGARGPAVVPGDPRASLLMAALRREPGVPAMPPDHALDAQELGALTRWIELGAPYGAAPLWGTWWSFAPRANPAAPEVVGEVWCLDELDRFVLAELEAVDLAPAPPAGRAAWLRRVTFDLTGLPPSPDEIEAFLGDGGLAAEERVVDRLLASRAYAERLGRMWLDVARYADTAGDSSDYPIEDAWRYRDWVVSSFERDVPYDRFVQLQVAGDLLAAHAPQEEFAEGVTATGFLALAQRFGVGRDSEMHLVREDSLDTLGRAVLGLGLSCARCHEHPFDPISQEEYFALEGILASTVYPFPGSENEQRPERLVPLLPPLELARVRREHAEALAAFEAARASDASNLSAPGPLLIDTAYACGEGTPTDSRVNKGGKPIPRGFPAALTVQGPPRIGEGSGSGRAELADWITRPDHPLTARVWANRLWAQLMGHGLVPTPSDFGRQGGAPSHPALLDHLAERLVQEGWSTRALLRRIALSATYRQASQHDERAFALDPGTRLLWRQPRRRLTAEELRDAVLSVSGALDLEPAGPHPFPPRARWSWTQHNPFGELYDHDRRSLYLMVPRLRRHPFLTLFDGADTNASHPVRRETVAPAQAHFLANSPWLHAQAERLARRLLEHSEHFEGRVGLLWLLAYTRRPAPDEVSAALALIEAYPSEGSELHPWAALARVVLASNEFLYLD
jgi:hypothetical protein